ncbi:MAG: pyruvate kinase alpha/beta domain-containing protein [Desulfobacterales bacterium]
MAKGISVEALQFEKPGPSNTDDCLRAAVRRASALKLRAIVVASDSGKTALKALDHAVPLDLQVIVVSASWGYQAPNEHPMETAARVELENRGASVVTAAHAFGGVGRAVRHKLETYQVDEIMAYTLRMLGQGVKVGVEIALMAADAGLVRTDEDIVCVAGTGRGADTAMVVQPANSHNAFDLKVREIIAKPRHF